VALFKNKKKVAENLIATGSKAVGTVVAVRDTGMTVNDNPRIKMTFRLEPLDGSPAFDAEKTRTVSRLEIPRQGDRYPVWYDPAEPTKTWMFSTVADDSGRETLRQLFGDVANTFVGMNAPAAPAAPAGTAPGPDTVETLKQLGDLHSQGLLTDEEFAAQKKKLLG
jgi:Short C-terminal domain